MYEAQELIFKLTVADFDDALEMVTDTKATLREGDREKILARVREDGNWAEWTVYFVEIVRDHLERVLAGEEA